MTRRRIARWSVAGGCLALVLAWSVFAYVFVIDPSADQPRRSDAIVVLGPLIDSKFQQAIDLARRLDIPEVVLSVGSTPTEITSPRCTKFTEAPHISCFVPDPFTTRGEAREIGQLAKTRHWHNVLVLSPTFQLSRARILIKRCYSGDLQMVETPIAQNVWGWMNTLVYQTGATIKALVERGC